MADPMLIMCDNIMQRVPVYIIIIIIIIIIILALRIRIMLATFLRDVTATFLNMTDTYVRTHIMRIDPGLESSLRSQLII